MAPDDVSADYRWGGVGRLERRYAATRGTTGAHVCDLSRCMQTAQPESSWDAHCMATQWSGPHVRLFQAAGSAATQHILVLCQLLLDVSCRCLHGKGQVAQLAEFMLRRSNITALLLPNNGLDDYSCSILAGALAQASCRLRGGFSCCPRHHLPCTALISAGAGPAATVVSRRHRLICPAVESVFMQVQCLI